MQKQTAPSPPPPPAAAAAANVVSHKATAQAPFLIKGEGGRPEGIVFSFPDVSTEAAAKAISLKNIVRQYLGGTRSTEIPSAQLYNILGRLRSLSYLLLEYNDGVRTMTSNADRSQQLYFLNYVKRRTLDQLSVFGFQIAAEVALIQVPGLSELIEQIEKIFQEEIRTFRDMIAGGTVVYEAFGELFRPDRAVHGTTNLAGSAGCYKVVEGYFEEKRTLMGTERTFHLSLEYLASLGDHFGVVRFEETFSSWMGVRARPITDLNYYPVAADDLSLFRQRGAKYYEFGVGGARFLHYKPGSFFMHTVGGKAGSMSRPAGSQSHGSGRMIIDASRGAQLGHHASQGFDEPTNALTQLSTRYRRWVNEQRSGSKGSTTENLHIMTEIPNELLAFCWPALVAFSFNLKAWGHVLVDGVENIQFNDRAFDQLVLPEERKRLIRALVTYGGDDDFQDIIGGKSGGSIFLLHGPPGVGKTLTAEAIAEALHRPLYYVTMGELGTTPEEMERRLADVLDLCAGWNALTIIDEADVFLEKRATSDVLRNAMVCVMLRLLEYHQGILFLTTNRVREFDPAFESRVTVALRYDGLTPAARAKVWKNLIGRLNIPCENNLDFDSLGKHEMNGRQIKNAVRLAAVLAKDDHLPLSQAHIDRTIEITSLGREDMKKAAHY
ncbi:uncharacterized protein SPPG_05366 [Spizellomyces punctatus DAOM BR117]|uniref:AAA+ ATPase domain-containing protein n=1 Tax=Spizellomyces punctatus (strain DAOM BR117) TaxID=645134 RepID=A0A0L0HDM4_SPIPD|nr:uncharacterized protein SPPG_05366 [Spizellomyces punctatus DAOM BR117]KNC99106.1 hypothetical protein SPPG_05366 [Spizellomyces punctatus DAOM BR117]|eukprot:XP_016607146.1 hypothetical protein SPPG_05366 [Spizellomyces punctatus DAOM BR117]